LDDYYRLLPDLNEELAGKNPITNPEITSVGGYSWDGKIKWEWRIRSRVDDSTNTISIYRTKIYTIAPIPEKIVPYLSQDPFWGKKISFITASEAVFDYDHRILKSLANTGSEAWYPEQTLNLAILQTDRKRQMLTQEFSTFYVIPPTPLMLAYDGIYAGQCGGVSTKAETADGTDLYVYTFTDGTTLTESSVSGVNNIVVYSEDDFKTFQVTNNKDRSKDYYLHGENISNHQFHVKFTLPNYYCGLESELTEAKVDADFNIAFSNDGTDYSNHTVSAFKIQETQNRIKIISMSDDSYHLSVTIVLYSNGKIGIGVDDNFNFFDKNTSHPDDLPLDFPAQYTEKVEYRHNIKKKGDGYVVTTTRVNVGGWTTSSEGLMDLKNYFKLARLNVTNDLGDNNAVVHEQKYITDGVLLSHSTSSSS
jgi:hypothetical protein